MTNIVRTRGDTYADEIVVMDADTGGAMDITGHTFILTVDPSRTPADALNNVLSLTGTILDPTAGLVEFAPTAEQADITPGKYYYDIQMTDDVGRIRTIQSGRYEIKQDITK